jgi:hypothetical protein
MESKKEWGKGNSCRGSPGIGRHQSCSCKQRWRECIYAQKREGGRGRERERESCEGQSELVVGTPFYRCQWWGEVGRASMWQAFRKGVTMGHQFPKGRGRGVATIHGREARRHSVQRREMRPSGPLGRTRLDFYRACVPIGKEMGCRDVDRNERKNRIFFMNFGYNNRIWIKIILSSNQKIFAKLK